MATKTRNYCDWCGTEVPFRFAATVGVTKSGFSNPKNYEICGACEKRLNQSIAKLKAEQHQ